MLFDSQEVVAQEVLIPRDRRADNVFDSGGLSNGGQGLVPEDDDENHRRRRGERGQRRQQTVGPPASADDSANGSRPHQKWGKRDQALRGECRAERRDNDRHRGGSQPLGRDRPLHQCPDHQHAQSDQRFGTQTVVERQPGGQENHPAGGDRDPVSGQAANPRSKARQDQVAEDQPACDRRRGSGQSHPHPGGADRGQLCQHRLVPVERRFGGTEVAVIVGGVAGLAGDPGDGQVVAVVGGDRPDQVPQPQGADHDGVDQPVPKRATTPAHGPPAAAVQNRQCRDRGDDADQSGRHHRDLERSRGGDEARVDIDPG